MKISVALAAYKGEKYIEEQIASILSQLGEDDEIIISDDLPGGKTEEAVSGIGDRRIRYIAGPGKGVVQNFKNAISHCTGDIIFLSDQDDVWLPGKVSRVTSEINSGADLVLHNAEITDGSLVKTGQTCFEMYNTGSGYTANLIRNTFVGCCMAFTKKLINDISPIPDDVPMHDWFIALAAMKKGYKVSLIDEPLMLWRRHGDNVTGGSTSLLSKVRFRLKMISCLISVPRGKDK